MKAFIATAGLLAGMAVSVTLLGACVPTDQMVRTVNDVIVATDDPPVPTTEAPTSDPAQAWVPYDGCVPHNPDVYDQTVFDLDFVRIDPAYGVWTYNGETVGWSSQEDVGPIWNTIECAVKYP